MKSEDVFDALPLPSLKRLSAGYAMRRIFTKAGPQDRVAYALAMNFIRLVDHAAQSYIAARQAMMDYVDSQEGLAWGKVQIGISQFELCVLSIRRAELMARGLAQYSGTPEGLRRCLPQSGKTLPKRISEPIMGLRNASQHLERRLLDGEIGDNEAVTLFPRQDALELGHERVRYDLLTEAICLLHTIASAISKFREESSQ